MELALRTVTLKFLGAPGAVKTQDKTDFGVVNYCLSAKGKFRGFIPILLLIPACN